MGADVPPLPLGQRGLKAGTRKTEETQLNPIYWLAQLLTLMQWSNSDDPVPWEVNIIFILW